MLHVLSLEEYIFEAVKKDLNLPARVCALLDSLYGSVEQLSLMLFFEKGEGPLGCLRAAMAAAEFSGPLCSLVETSRARHIESKRRAGGRAREAARAQEIYDELSAAMLAGHLNLGAAHAALRRFNEEKHGVQDKVLRLDKATKYIDQLVGLFEL